MYALSAVTTPVAISPAATAAIAALSQLPCWSDQAHACVDTAGPSTLANCPAIRAAYVNPSAADRAALDAAVEAVPFCPAPSSQWMYWVGAAALGFAFGIVVARAV